MARVAESARKKDVTACLAILDRGDRQTCVAYHALLRARNERDTGVCEPIPASMRFTHGICRDLLLPVAPDWKVQREEGIPQLKRASLAPPRTIMFRETRS